jgi:hypothetical protein
MPLEQRHEAATLRLVVAGMKSGAAWISPTKTLIYGHF